MTRTVKIQPEGSNTIFDSFEDWGLAIENNNYIGTPVKETSYITVPGASIDIDLSEALTGTPVYKYRPISIMFGGKENPDDWDIVVSDIRNKVEGRICTLTFDNDPNFYWRGRVSIDGFDRVRTLGRFTLNVEHADPFKYDVFSSTDNWLWDPFDFENGIIRYIPEFEVDGTKEVVFPKSNKQSVPTFVVSEITTTLSVVSNGTTHNLIVGDNRFPSIKVETETETTISIVGKGTLSIQYRGGSL